VLILCRAETYDTMLAWYSDISNLIEKTGDERNAFVRRHTRSISAGSARSVSSDGGLEEDDEADQVPFSTQHSVLNQPTQEVERAPSRPSPGGRFPSDIHVNRDLQAPVGPSSGSSSEVGNDLTTASGFPSGGLHGTYPAHQTDPNDYDHYQQSVPGQTYDQDVRGYGNDGAYQAPASLPVQQTSYYANNPPANPVQTEYQQPIQPVQPIQPIQPPQAYNPEQPLGRHGSTYGDWMAPAAGGAAVGALGAGAYAHHQQQAQENPQLQPAFDEATQTDLPTPQPVPARHPEHTASLTNPAFAPIPAASEREPDSLATTPSAVHQPFLGGPETVLPAPVSAQAVGSGASVHPGINRNNTDFSVSELHVPGEYPKVPKGV
jgi:hypothetical protein